MKLVDCFIDCWSKFWLVRIRCAEQALHVESELIKISCFARNSCFDRFSCFHRIRRFSYSKTVVDSCFNRFSFFNRFSWIPGSICFFIFWSLFVEMTAVDDVTNILYGSNILAHEQYYRSAMPTPGIQRYDMKRIYKAGRVVRVLIDSIKHGYN